MVDQLVTGSVQNSAKFKYPYSSSRRRLLAALEWWNTGRDEETEETGETVY
jgi:hypothetical protein